MNESTYKFTSAPLSRLRRSIRYACRPLVPNFQTELAPHLQQRI